VSRYTRTTHSLTPLIDPSGNFQSNLKGVGADVFSKALIPLLNQSTFWGQSQPSLVPERHRVRKLLGRPDPDWLDLKLDANSSGLISWSSLSGAAVYGLDSYNTVQSNWIGDYTQPTSYIFANCDPHSVFADLSAFPKRAHPNSEVFFDVLNSTSNDTSGNPYPLVEVWARDGVNVSAHTSCTLERHYVEVQASCDAAACVVKKIRPNPDPDLDQPFPSADKFLASKNIAQAFFDNLLLSTGTPTNISDTMVIVPSAIGSDVLSGDGTQPDWNTISQDLSLLINGYIQAAQIHSNSPIDPTSDPQTVAICLGVLHNTTFYPTATAKGAIYSPQYVLSYLWVTLDLLTCTVLFLAATASMWLRTRTVAPDIFGCKLIKPVRQSLANKSSDVSSMTRDNPLMMLPEGGSTMSGTERARALKDVKVRVAEVGTADGVGSIKLAAVHPNIEMGNLEKRKRYL
jgi:hypothetical protein